MGGGNDLPGSAQPAVAAPTSSEHEPEHPGGVYGEHPVYGNAEEQPSEEEGGGFLRMLFGGGSSSATTPRCPEYVPEDLRVACVQEAAIARESLQARADDWSAAVATAREAGGHQPDLGVKFVYAWTLSKCPGPEEQRLGFSLLMALLEEDHYAYPDEATYALALAYYLRGDLKPARHFCESLLRMRPDSDRAMRLHALIRSAQSYKAEKSFETAAVGGALLLGVAGLALAFAAGGKKR